MPIHSLPISPLPFPEEIVCHILASLTSDSSGSFTTLISSQTVSKRFGAASKVSSVWKPQYDARWSYTSSKRNVVKLGVLNEYKRRVALDKRVKELHGRLMDEESGKAEIVDEVVTGIGEEAYDALDRLAYSDSLSIAFWATELLDSLRRGTALLSWKRLCEQDREHALYNDYAEICGSFSAFVQSSYTCAASSREIVQMLHDLDPFELAPSITVEMSLREIVSLLWDGMVQAGFLKPSLSIESHLIDQVLERSRKLRFPRYDLPPQTPPPAPVISVILYYLLANLPEAYHINTYITQMRTALAPVVFVERNDPVAKPIYVDVGVGGRLHSLESILLEYPRWFERPENNLLCALAENLVFDTLNALERRRELLASSDDWRDFDDGSELARRTHAANLDLSTLVFAAHSLQHGSEMLECRAARVRPWEERCFDSIVLDGLPLDLKSKVIFYNLVEREHEPLVAMVEPPAWLEGAFFDFGFVFAESLNDGACWVIVGCGRSSEDNDFYYEAVNTLGRIDKFSHEEIVRFAEWRAGSINWFNSSNNPPVLGEFFDRIEGDTFFPSAYLARTYPRPTKPIVYPIE